MTLIALSVVLLLQGAPAEAQRMTAGGWVFMAGAWIFIITLVYYTFSKVLRGSRN